MTNLKRYVLPHRTFQQWLKCKESNYAKYWWFIGEVPNWDPKGVQQTSRMAIKIRRYPPLSQQCTRPNSCQINENNATVLNEHGYFGSPIRHYCRLCEALNYNNRCRFDEVIPHLECREDKSFNDLSLLWSRASSCRKGFWGRGKQQQNVTQSVNCALWS